MSDKVNRSLKEALHATIHKNRKSVAAIAEEIGMSENYLYRAALPDQEMDGQGTGCRFPLKGLVPLVRATSDFQVLDYIERILGRVAIVLPTGDGDFAEISRRSMRAIGEFGELMQEIDKSLDDGKITASELEMIEKEGYEAVQAIMAMLSVIKSSRK